MNTLKILIVDDDRDFAESMDILLQVEGHDVEVVYNGGDAIQVFREKEFDITFMDVRMPGANGVECLSEFRKIRSDARVVMMTGYSVEQLLNEAINVGALDVLHKPFDVEELLQTVETVKPEGIILIADDDQEFVQSMEIFLDKSGYCVIVANTSKEAVEKVVAGPVDVLILDLRLPIINCLEVYLELKKLKKVVPTIIITGYAREESRRLDKFRALPLTGCLIKPFDPQELLIAIESLAGGQFNAGNRLSRGNGEDPA